jgi:hypothetical protein
MWNLESTNPYTLDWNVNMRSAEQIGGLIDDNGTPGRLTEGAGIEQYQGGDLLAAASTVYLVSAEDVLQQGNLARKGVTISTPIATWTSDTPASRTGSFDAGVDTTYVGEGSIIRVFDPITKTTYQSTIMVLTNDGDADDEVETATLIPSGTVEYLGPMYDYIGGASGMITPQGFKVATTGTLNTSGELVCFEAGTYL